jgi:hypothetical protein
MLTDTLTVKDWGNRAPRCAELRVAMPAGMSWLGATSSQGAIAIEGGELVVRLGAVPMLTSIDIAVDWQMDTPGLHPRTYVVSSTEYPESHPSNNTLVLGN